MVRSRVRGLVGARRSLRRGRDRSFGVVTDLVELEERDDGGREQASVVGGSDFGVGRQRLANQRGRGQLSRSHWCNSP